MPGHRVHRGLTREHDAVVAEIAEVRALLRDHDVDGAAKAARRIAEIRGRTPRSRSAGSSLMRQEFPSTSKRSSASTGSSRTPSPKQATARPPTRAGRLGCCPRWSCCATTSSRNRTASSAALSVLDTEGWELVEAVRARAGSAVGNDGPARGGDEGTPTRTTRSTRTTRAPLAPLAPPTPDGDRPRAGGPRVSRNDRQSTPPAGRSAVGSPRGHETVLHARRGLEDKRTLHAKGGRSGDSLP